MQCEVCSSDLKELACGHDTCTKCIEVLATFGDFGHSENWCPHCENDDFEKFSSIIEIRMNSVLEGIKQKKKELKLAAESREQMIAEVVHIRCSVESLLRQKELQVMENLDEAYEELQKISSEDLKKCEEELEAIGRCRRLFPRMSTSNTERSHFNSNAHSHGPKDLASPKRGSVSDNYRLKLEPDDRFWQAINKLLVLPIGQVSLVSTNEELPDPPLCLDQGIEPTLEITSELFSVFDYDEHAPKSGHSPRKDFLLSVDTDDCAKSPISTCARQKRRIASEATSTPLTPPTSDSGLSSMFTFSGVENVSENQGDPQLSKCRRRSNPLPVDSPITSNKFVRSASSKIRNFLHNLRRSNIKRKRVSEKKSHNNQIHIDPRCSPHDQACIDSKVVLRKKPFQAGASERFSPVMRQIRSLSCSQLGSSQLPNPDTDLNFPETSMMSFSDPPSKLIEFTGLIDGEQSCWLLDIAFLDDDKHFVVFDAINQNLKKFETSTGKLSSVLRLSSEKSCVAVLSSSRLAVTLPEAKQIGYVNYLEQLSMSRKISTSKVYIGITALTEDRLVCASNSFGSSIDVLSLDCEILASFSKENLYDDAPLFPTYLATTPDGNILISDRIKRGLICLNMAECRVDFFYCGREDLAVTWPAGVACDDQGNIYLADCFKTNLHRLSPAGEFERLYMSQGDDVQMCRAVDVSSNGKLILTEYRSKNIKVFNL